jgi:hypothetical protein
MIQGNTKVFMGLLEEAQDRLNHIKTSVQDQGLVGSGLL